MHYLPRKRFGGGAVARFLSFQSITEMKSTEVIVWARFWWNLRLNVLRTVNIIHTESYSLCGKGKHMTILSKNARKPHFYFFSPKHRTSNKCVFDAKVFSEIHFFSILGCLLKCRKWLWYIGFPQLQKHQEKWIKISHFYLRIITQNYWRVADLFHNQNVFEDLTNSIKSFHFQKETQ